MSEAIPIGIAAAFACALALFAWRRHAMPMAPAFAVMMTGETAWALGAALEPIVVEVTIKRLCLDLRILGTLIATSRIAGLCIPLHWSVPLAEQASVRGDLRTRRFP